MPVAPILWIRGGIRTGQSLEGIGQNHMPFLVSQGQENCPHENTGPAAPDTGLNQIAVNAVVYDLSDLFLEALQASPSDHGPGTRTENDFRILRPSPIFTVLGEQGTDEYTFQKFKIRTHFHPSRSFHSCTDCRTSPSRSAHALALAPCSARYWTSVRSRYNSS